MSNVRLYAVRFEDNTFDYIRFDSQVKIDFLIQLKIQHVMRKSQLTTAVIIRNRNGKTANVDKVMCTKA